MFLITPQNRVKYPLPYSGVYQQHFGPITFHRASAQHHVQREMLHRLSQRTGKGLSINDVTHFWIIVDDTSHYCHAFHRNTYTVVTKSSQVST